MLVSATILLRVSLVILFLESLTFTSPIRLDAAKHSDGSGSETTLSLLICGKSSLTGWEYLSSVKGATVGWTDALRTFRW